MAMLSTTIFRHSCWILALLLTLVLQVAAYGQTVVHVDGDNGLAVPNLPDPGDSWDNAFKYLNDAIAFAKLNPGAEDLWVAATDPSNPYVPDRDAANPDGTGDRSATFLLDFNNIRLLGGFDGTETLPEERDPADNITVLSGDISNVFENCAPDSGDCFTATPGIPGCDDLCGGDPPDACPGCCTIVCEIDPLCCLEGFEWTEGCVDIADANCTGGEANRVAGLRSDLFGDRIAIFRPISEH